MTNKSIKTTFTKSIMALVMLLYFIGSLLGGALVILAAASDIKLGNPIDSAMFIAYAAYIGGPTATGIGFYAWKSKAENLLKLQNSGTNTDLTTALADMRGED